MSAGPSDRTLDLSQWKWQAALTIGQMPNASQ